MTTRANCKGCSLRIQYGHRKVCKITPTDIYDIYNCPCKVCLIKMSCSAMCSNFVKTFDSEFHWKFKVNTLRPNKRWLPTFEESLQHINNNKG